MISEEDVRNDLTKLIRIRDLQIKAEQSKNQDEIRGIGKRGEQYNKQVMNVLRKQKIDVEAITAIEDARAKTAENETAKVRKDLIKSKPEESVSTPNLEQVQSVFFVLPIEFPYYTKVYGGSGTEGYYIGDLRELVASSGGGSGWGASGHNPNEEVTIDRWFTFIPPTTRFYQLVIFQPYNGFYICRADDGIWTSKEAWLTIDGSLQGYQYFYHAESRFTALSIGSDNIDTYGRFDTVFPTFYGDSFAVGDRAYLRVTQRLRCHARGDGSHAEINFSDGTANVLHAPLVLGLLPP